MQKLRWIVLTCVLILWFFLIVYLVEQLLGRIVPNAGNKQLFTVKNESTSSKLILYKPNKSIEFKKEKSAKNLTRETHVKEIDEEKSEGAKINSEPVIAVTVIACNRVAIARCLDKLLKFRPSARQFPIIVSQDCKHEPTSEVIHSYGDKIIYIQQPDQSRIIVPAKENQFKGYYKIARHYRWALNQTFFKFNYNYTIIIEDDLDVSLDIYEYFLGTLPILQADPTLWCVSAWNDNGNINLIQQDAPHLLHRTDFFPGLGWMLSKQVWEELFQKWPVSYWDDWLRQPEQRQGRACIRPEISRTATFGQIGVSKGFFFEAFLKKIHLNKKFVRFTEMNLKYLLKDNYDAQFFKSVYANTMVLTHSELLMNDLVGLWDGPFRIPYETIQEFTHIANMLGLMSDTRSDVPRTAYEGVVEFYYKKYQVYLAPFIRWKE